MSEVRHQHSGTDLGQQSPTPGLSFAAYTVSALTEPSTSPTCHELPINSNSNGRLARALSANPIGFIKISDGSLLRDWIWTRHFVNFTTPDAPIRPCAYMLSPLMSQAHVEFPIHRKSITTLVTGMHTANSLQREPERLFVTRWLCSHPSLLSNKTPA
jgi:hypothetical protein